MISQAFLQPEVRARRPRRICVCDAFFASERCSAGLLVHLYRCGLVSGAGGVRARELLQRYTHFESGRLERRRLHRQARRHQAGGALEGERDRSALHLAIAIRLRDAQCQ